MDGRTRRQQHERIGLSVRRRTVGEIVAGTVLLSLAALSAVSALFVAPAAAAVGPGARLAAASPAPSYIPAGMPVDGGDNQATGPLLPGPGLYLDTLPQGSGSISQPGSDKFYTVELPMGATPWFSATLLFPPKQSNAAPGAVTLQVYDLNDDTRCSWGNRDYDNESSSATQPISVATVLPVVGGSVWRQRDCPLDQRYVVEVYRSGELFPNDSAKVEIGYRIEPPASTAGIPTTPATAGAAVPVTGGGQVRRMTAGYSFNNAPVLAPGRYRDTIVAGQTRYVRIHLEWGQRFSYLFQSDSVPALGDVGLSAWTTLFNPMRGVLQPTSTTSTFVGGFGGTDAEPVTGTTDVQVRFANRDASVSDPAEPYSIDGDYFLALTLGYGDSTRPASVPYTLVVSVSGRREPGPHYDPAQLSLANAGAPGGAATGSSDPGSDAGVILGGGAAAVVLIAGVGFWLWSRARPAHAGPAGPIGLPPGRGPAPGPAPAGRVSAGPRAPAGGRSPGAAPPPGLQPARKPLAEPVPKPAPRPTQGAAQGPTPGPTPGRRPGPVPKPAPGSPRPPSPGPSPRPPSPGPQPGPRPGPPGGPPPGPGPRPRRPS